MPVMASIFYGESSDLTEQEIVERISAVAICCDCNSSGPLLGVGIPKQQTRLSCCTANVIREKSRQNYL